MVSKALFTSNTVEWSTPRPFFETLNDEFHFTIDVCATKENALCPVFFTKEQNGLKQPWSGNCFGNLPYGRGVMDWINKAATEAVRCSATSVFLVPARPDTKWFRQAFETATELRLIKGRLKFGGAKTPAPFPSCVFVFRPGYLGVQTVRYM